jgi:hypothetical protein
MLQTPYSQYGAQPGTADLFSEPLSPEDPLLPVLNYLADEGLIALQHPWLSKGRLETHSWIFITDKGLDFLIERKPKKPIALSRFRQAAVQNHADFQSNFRDYLLQTPCPVMKAPLYDGLGISDPSVESSYVGFLRLFAEAIGKHLPKKQTDITSRNGVGIQDIYQRFSAQDRQKVDSAVRNLIEAGLLQSWHKGDAYGYALTDDAIETVNARY